MSEPYRGLNAALARNSGPSAEDVEALADPTLTVADVNALTGDDIESWLTNPFMSPDMLAEKVCWWVTVAEARGAERGARAVVEAVEIVLNDTEWSGWDGREVFTDRLLYIVRRAARVEGGA